MIHFLLMRVTLPKIKYIPGYINNAIHVQYIGNNIEFRVRDAGYTSI